MRVVSTKKRLDFILHRPIHPALHSSTAARIWRDAWVLRDTEVAAYRQSPPADAVLRSDLCFDRLFLLRSFQYRHNRSTAGDEPNYDWAADALLDGHWSDRMDAVLADPTPPVATRERELPFEQQARATAESIEALMQQADLSDMINQASAGIKHRLQEFPSLSGRVSDLTGEAGSGAETTTQAEAENNTQPVQRKLTCSDHIGVMAHIDARAVRQWCDGLARFGVDTVSPSKEDTLDLQALQRMVRGHTMIDPLPSIYVRNRVNHCHGGLQ